MAVIVSAETITVRTPERAILDAVSLGVQTGERIGVLGLNGAGKSTLLAVLAGQRQPDAGRVAPASNARIVTVNQQLEPTPGQVVRDVVLATLGGGQTAEYVWARDSDLRNIFTGLGLETIGLDSPVNELSGGQWRRVCLAAALVTDADLLLLDEPTNHLDLEAIAWLAQHLLDRKTAVITVTHDRWFLDAVAQYTWEIADGQVHIREGGYSDWIFARAERARLAEAAEERRRNLARKELAWLRRGPPARTSKPRYRIAAAEALIADVPPPRNQVDLAAVAKHRLGRKVLELHNVTYALPDGRQLLENVTELIGPGDRRAIVGANGAGKSTLLRLLAGEITADSGKLSRGQTVRVGFLRQNPEPVDPDLRVLEAVTEIAGSIDLGGGPTGASQLAERFGFTPAQQRQQVARLSGGERRRLQLLRLLASEPNVLLLDEPTNDLDTDTLAALEDLLDTWPGTLLVVSHDRYFLERITDSVWAMFGDGSLRHQPGGIDEYLAAAKKRHKLLGAATSATPAPVSGNTGLSSDERRQLGKDLQRIEKQLESLRRKETRIHQQLAGAGADYELATQLNAELAEITADIAAREEEWLLAAERLEGD